MNKRTRSKKLEKRRGSKKARRLLSSLDVARFSRPSRAIYGLPLARC